MSGRSPFFVRAKNHYSNGVLFYTGTVNRFNLINFFEYTLEPGQSLVLDANSTLSLIVRNKPSSFNLVQGTTYSFSPQVPLNNYTMYIDFVYTQTGQGSSESEPYIITKLNCLSQLKIVVR
jgi:hypothetical protein